MSQVDNNTPAPEAGAGRRATPTGGPLASVPGGLPVVIGVALLLVLGVIAIVLLGGDDEGEAGNADCVVDTIRMTAAPALVPIVEGAVKAVEADEECLDVELEAGTVKDVIAILNDPDGQMPDLWIPDSPTWKGQLAAAGYAGTVVADAVAETPVGLASGPAADAPASWLAALQGGRIAMADPSADGASALALLAPYAEAKKTGTSDEAIKAATVPVAQIYGERLAKEDTTTNDVTAVSTTSTQLIPITERDFLAARRTNDQLTMVAPRTGVPMLQFPIIDVNKAGFDMFGSGGADRSDRAARAGRALAHWFASGEGQAAVSEAEFRVPGAGALQGGTGLGQARTLGRVDQRVTDEALRSWRVLTVPSSLLAVFDVSGSMDARVGGVSRMRLAVDAGLTALDVFPDRARIGVWAFSIDQGGRGQDWRVLAPLRRLDAKVNGETQKQLLRREVPKLVRLTRGGTGLYDTTFAAYKQAVKDYDPSFFNAVVIMTDGANDDAGSLSLNQLLAGLERLRDPNRPVRVVSIGISNDADMGALQQISAVTGGQSYLAENPKDILLVLAQALLAR